jgi:hypothetical protein
MQVKQNSAVKMCFFMGENLRKQKYGFFVSEGTFAKL